MMPSDLIWEIKWEKDRQRNYDIHCISVSQKSSSFLRLILLFYASWEPCKSVLFLIWLSCQENRTSAFIYNCTVWGNLCFHAIFLSLWFYFYFSHSPDLLLILFLSKLKQNCFTMLCYFQVYSKVIQLYMYIYTFFFRFFSLIGYYKILSIVPCAMQ